MEILTGFVQWLARTSAEASVLIVLALLVMTLLGRYLSPGWRYAFGVAILLRLVLPVDLPSSLSLFNTAGAQVVSKWFTPEPADLSTTARASEQEARAPSSHVSLTGFIAEAEPSKESLNPLQTSEPLSLLWPALAFTWLCGALYFLFRLGIGYRNFQQELSRFRPVRSPLLLRLLDTCLTEMNLSRPVAMVRGPKHFGVAVTGWKTPRLIVPRDFENTFSPEEQRGILLHELAHLRRGDLIWNWAAELVRALHWFNPLVWLALRQWESDRELLCDRMALRHLGHEGGGAYGHSLIKMLKTLSTNVSTPATPAMAPIVNSGTKLKQRIHMIAKTQNPHWLAHLLAAAVLTALCALTYTSATADDEKPKPEESGDKADHPEAKTGPRDGDTPKEGPRDGDVPKTGPRDTGKPSAEGGDKPSNGSPNTAQAHTKEGKIFNTYDKDKDGKVSADEIAAMREGKLNSAQRREIRKQIDKSDQDGDDLLDLAEFTYWLNEGRRGE